MAENFRVNDSLIKISKDSPILRKHIILALANKEPYGKTILAYEEFLSLTQYPDLVRALLYAIERHEGQYYEWKSGKKLPYSYHACKCGINSINLGSSKNQVIIALWHDLIEDKKANSTEIAIELKNKIYSNINPTAIINSLILLDKAGISAKDYFLKLLQDKNASIAKAADIISNLDECIARFDEMVKSGQRFWIYGYLIEIPNYFLSNTVDLPDNVISLISSRISLLLSALPEKSRLELKKYSKGVLKNE